MFEFKILDSQFVNDIVALTKRVFDSHVGPQYSQGGVEEFYKYITPESFKDRLNNDHILIGCIDENKLIAILEIRKNDHISLFFVDNNYQERGVGREIFNYYLNFLKETNVKVEELSVNSSPNSVLFYEKLGFKKLGLEKEKNGIKYNLMRYTLQTEPTLTSSS